MHHVPNAKLCFTVTCAITWIVSGALAFADHPAPTSRPNILWITCEDSSPNLGCYGDRYANTPNLDRLAQQSVRYTHAFAPIGVCAPSRSCLITGMYASSLGTQHMRCDGKLPDMVRCFPAYLRDAGYYCTNDGKTDYNFEPPKEAWDENSKQAHWHKRPDGRPFFTVVNLASSHESRIVLADDKFRKLASNVKHFKPHDPQLAPLPPYHPDTPEVRRDWARYYDALTVMDHQAGQILEQLDNDGLSDDTIVFFFSDHGAGMPRSKRWLYDSSLKVPLLVRFPPKYASLASGKPGSVCDRLVSFVDFAPTILSLAGVEIPTHMQGGAFLGNKTAKPQEYVFGYRDRMDERYDLLRCVRDRRYKYIRNFRPDLPYFGRQNLETALKNPTLQVWQQLSDQGKLEGSSAIFMALSKPVEELYDTATDPCEVHNLAADPAHREQLERMRSRLDQWMIETVDLGLLPEADLRTRFGDTAPYTAVRAKSPQSLYPLAQILRLWKQWNLESAKDESLVEHLDDTDPAVRYWAAIGLGRTPKGQDAAAIKALAKLAEREAETPIVRAAACESLCRLEQYDSAIPILADLMNSDNEWVRLYAANALDRAASHGQPAIEALRRGQSDSNQYVQRVCRHAVRTLTTVQP